MQSIFVFLDTTKVVDLSRMSVDDYVSRIQGVRHIIIYCYPFLGDV